MNLKSLPEVLRRTITNFYENSSKIESKIFFKFKDDMFYLSFVFGGKSVFNPEQLNGSHENLILYKIEHFIESKTYQSGELQFVFNYDDESSYKFYMYVIEIKELMISNDLQEKLEQKRIEKLNEKENKKLTNNTEKMYKLIFWNKDGLSLGKIIQKSRYFKTPDERKNSLQMLINQGKIRLQCDTSRGKNKKVYFPI